MKPKKPVKPARAEARATNEATFTAGINAAGKPLAKVAATVQTTPIAHQSGNGIRGYREKIGGLSKVSFIRWCGACGFDPARVFRFVSTYCYMTRAVCQKAYREGVALTRLNVETPDPTIAKFAIAQCR